MVEKNQLAVMNLVHIEDDFKNARIKSAIKKGKQTMLTSDSEIKGASLSKFEHKGKDGNLVVYTQDGANKNDKPINYKVLASFRAPDSLRNQLFFADEGSPRTHTTRSDQISQIQTELKTGTISKNRTKKSFAPKAGVQTRSETKAKAVLPKLGSPEREMQEKPDSFEQVLTKYKSKRQREKRILGLGDEHLEFADKLGSMYIERKIERNKMRAKFSVSDNISQEDEKEDDKRVQFNQENDKLQTQNRVQEAMDRQESGKKAKTSNRVSKIPPNKRQKRILPRLSRKELLSNMKLFSESSNQYEKVSLKLPKI